MTDDQSTVLDRIRTGLQTYVDMVHDMTDGRLPGNEEQTKAAIISPFVRDVLGWSSSEGTCLLEAPAAPGGSAVNRVDYAISPDGDHSNPTLLIEAKKASCKLTKNEWMQTYQYYGATKSTVCAVLTNGLQWRMYTDMDADGYMDDFDLPFYSFDLTDEDLDVGRTTEALSMIAAGTANFTVIKQLAADFKLRTDLEDLVSADLAEPSDELIEHWARQVMINKRFTKRLKETARRTAKGTIRTLVQEQSDKALKSIAGDKLAGSSLKVKPGSSAHLSVDGLHLLWTLQGILADMIAPDELKVRISKSCLSFYIDKPDADRHMVMSVWPSGDKVTLIVKNRHNQSWYPYYKWSDDPLATNHVVDVRAAFRWHLDGYAEGQEPAWTNAVIDPYAKTDDGLIENDGEQARDDDVHTIECSGASDGEGTDDIDTESESIPDPPAVRHALIVNPFLRAVQA